MLRTGMIDMTRKERIAVDTLLDKLGDPKAGISRADPGETGPLLIKLEGATYEVHPDGETREVSGG